MPQVNFFRAKNCNISFLFSKKQQQQLDSSSNQNVQANEGRMNHVMCPDCLVFGFVSTLENKHIHDTPYLCVYANWNYANSWREQNERKKNVESNRKYAPHDNNKQTRALEFVFFSLYTINNIDNIVLWILFL